MTGHSDMTIKYSRESKNPSKAGWHLGECLDAFAQKFTGFVRVPTTFNMGNAWVTLGNPVDMCS